MTSGRPETERPAAEPDAGSQEARMREVLECQRAAFRAEGPPDAKKRMERLERAAALLLGNEKAIVDALSSDFGHRSPHLSALADVASPVGALRYAKRRVRQWMAPERRRVEPPMLMMGGRAWIEYQPLGVVGIVSPWNYPLVLSMIPLADALAAGNRAMIKPSEHTPATAELLARIVRSAFDQSEVAVVTGDASTGAAFCRLPFDHLVFTGSTRVARMVLHAAAENLVPVTLELGGKCPVVVGTRANLKLVASRVALAKTMNAGQICMAPDYLLAPRQVADRLVDLIASKLAAMYPTIADNPDYTSIINIGHLNRLQGYLSDARDKGARIVEACSAGESAAALRARKLPPAILLDVTDDMTVMQEEIFGPILPVVGYDRIDEAIGHVNDRPRPLALYYFGSDRTERRRVLRETTSGGVCLNDVAMQYHVPDIPFGGVGPSGFGAYRGVHGFRTFSHAKGVCELPHLDIPSPAEPPFGRAIGLLKRIWQQQ